MKTLIIFNQPAPYKVNLFNELSKYTDIDVIFERKTCSNRNKKFYEDNKFNFNVHFLKWGAIGEEGSISKELARYIKAHHQEYSLIIMNGYSHLAEIKAIKYMNKHHIKWTLMINGGLVKKEKDYKKRMKTKLISSASKYLSPCIEADEYLLYYGARKEDIYHYPNSTIFSSQTLKEPISQEEKLELKRKMNFPLDKRIFVSPSQFISRKNVIGLLKGFIYRPNDYLVLVGDGKQEKRVREFIKVQNMNNVSVLPYVSKSDVLKIFKASDFFITLSKEDIYGHTTNEAMSQGLPVISSDKVVSSKHLIKNGVNGYLIKYNDTMAFIDVVGKINNTMTYEAIKTAKENTIENSALCIFRIIKEISQ